MTTNDFSDAGDFIRDVFTSTFDACRMRGLWIPAVTFSFAMDAAAVAVNWPFRDGLNPPPEHTITVMVLLILAKGWFSLTLCRIALAGVRGQVTGVLNQWVSVQDALRIGFITVIFMFPILLGLAFLIVPGLYMLGRWSQVTMVLVDDQARGLEAGEESSALTVGFRPAILIVLLTVATVSFLVTYLVGDSTPLAWIHRAVGSTAGAALAASIYFELTRRDSAVC